MARRIELQALLEDMLGSRNVYYQSPPSKDMSYPAIRYSKKRIEKRGADDVPYIVNYSYELIVISRTPDHPVIEKILSLPFSRHERGYVADNLHHDVITLYF